MKQLYTLFFIVIALFAQGQVTQLNHAPVVLQDFSNLKTPEFAPNYLGFEGVTATNALVDDPVDATNKVREYTTAADGEIWQGIVLRPQTNLMNLTTTKTVSVKVYSTVTTHLKGKVQGGVGGNPDAESGAEAHDGSGWKTLTFDFASTSATGEYGELAIFVNVDASGNFIDPATTGTAVYVDDLTAAAGAAINAPTGPTTSPTAPTKSGVDVISIYSDAYTDIATNYNPNWGQAGDVVTTFDPGDSNNVLAYYYFNYQGTELTTTDVSSMENLHVDIWVGANVRTVKVTPILTAGSPAEFLVTVPVTAGSWNSVDIPLTNFTGLDFSNTVKELKFDGQFETDGVTADTGIRTPIFLDNIYFWKAPTMSVDEFGKNGFSVYPNPINDVIEIRAAQAVHHVRIHDLTGKEVLRAAPNAESFSLDVSNLNKGMYLVSLKAGDKEMTTKLVK